MYYHFSRISRTLVLTTALMVSPLFAVPGISDPVPAVTSPCVPSSDTVQIIKKLRAKVDPYLERVTKQPDWLYSRLQMFWSTHATEVFCHSESFDHPGGGRAPEPTVKMDGTRSHQSFYNRPKIEDLVPYDDDGQGNVTFINPKTGKMEKVNPNMTGRNISSINVMILSIARDAARLYRLTGDRRYADMALPVVRTYLGGIYYRNPATDLDHGHMQTLYGYSSFEVIHEDAISELYEAYPILRPLMGDDDCKICDGALKKWAENIIANGVPHNNWDLYQAEFIARIALMLDPDKTYADGRGRDYYLRYILNENSIRQWSLNTLADFGFDPVTHIWYECPGYSLGVLGDFSSFADLLDEQAGIDLFKEIPVLLKSLPAATQYLTPARMPIGFGDTHPSWFPVKGIESVLRYACRHRDAHLYARFDSLRQAVAPDAPVFLIERYVSPLFYARNASWLVQRTGMDWRHDLMVSLNASKGNHMHANGISLELYGKGYMLGPDAGIGKYLYSGDDYKEYYSQMPAHNTVVVDGVSTYAAMWSEHPFTVVDTCSVLGCSHSVLSFREPETNSLQQRTTGIVRTSDTGGYYVDIFRSHRSDGHDKMHDYFYHNLGQKMTLTAADGSPLDLRPTDELAFAGGHLYAYSYIYDKQSAEMSKDIKAQFAVNDSIFMTMWMKQEPDRRVFQALSPVNMQYERMPDQPYDIDQQPVLTFVARQSGEAWNRPFVCVFEPSTTSEPSEIASVDYFKPKSDDEAAVGIIVRLKTGRTDYIFSSSTGAVMGYKGMRVKGYYKVVTKE